MAQIKLSISNTGVITAIHNDALVPLYEEGECKISRASHVEPTENAEWTADMAPLNGPVLGPYKLRQDALDAEVAWINKELF